MLWKKAIPVKKRLKEIEEDMKRDFIETIKNPKEILELIPKIILNAFEEILIIFSNLSAFEIFESEINLTNSLRNQIKNGITVRMLIHDNISKNNQSKGKRNIFLNLFQMYPNKFKLQCIESNIYNRLNIIIADEELLLTIESKNIIENIDKESYVKNEDEIFQTIGLATYSNSESTTQSYATIFESLWLKSELSYTNN